ncbi:MAG: dipeptidase PepE [Actinomycetota bacterium]
MLGSGGFRSPARRQFLIERMQGFFGPVEKILFIPYAIARHDWYVERLTERELNAGYLLEGIHRHADPVKAVELAEGIYVGGGNTFRLLDELYRRRLMEAISRRVRSGLPYLGISAGANVACPTIKTTNDMPIVAPLSLDALDLVPFQVNAHYFSGPVFVGTESVRQQHFGETRDERLAEFHEMNDTPVIGLREGAVLEIVDGKVELAGEPARLFVKGEEPRDVDPGGRIWPPEIATG